MVKLGKLIEKYIGNKEEGRESHQVSATDLRKFNQHKNLKNVGILENLTELRV